MLSLFSSTAVSFAPASAVCQPDMSRLESIAQSGSSGKRPDGRCYSHVADYIDQSGYGGIAKGGFDSAIPSAYWSEAHQFADYLNKDGNAARLNLEKMSLTNPYEAPSGAIVVVRAGTPGTVNPTAGDIAVKGGGDSFYNGGEMGYGGSGNFPPGNDYVLGIYEPTKCSGGPSPPSPGPSPSGGCKSCVSGGGGKACESKCESCGSACISCIEGGGGMACADRCCDSSPPKPARASVQGDPVTCQKKMKQLCPNEPTAKACYACLHEHTSELRPECEGTGSGQAYCEPSAVAPEGATAAERGGSSWSSVFFNEDFVALLKGEQAEADGATCSAVGDCGKSYQACCIAYGIKGYPCGCHLEDGTGTAGANCGTCGTEFAACCVGFAAKGYPCKCNVA